MFIYEQDILYRVFKVHSAEGFRLLWHGGASDNFLYKLISQRYRTTASVPILWFSQNFESF